MVLLYDDTTSYDFKEVLRLIKSNKYYAYIKHLPEEKEKKPHYHCILSFENATKISTLSNKLGIPKNYIEVIKNVRSANRYLIHKDDDDKIQYDKSQVIVSPMYERKFNISFDDLLTEEQIIDDIYNYISCLKDFSFSEALRYLIIFVNKHCYDTIYKRYRVEFVDYLKDIVYK